MAEDALKEGLVQARSLLIDLERHIDRAATEGDIGDVGRAWVRAAQVERTLRGLLPDGATAEAYEQPDDTGRREIPERRG